jgi:hypothetical protein
MTTQITTTERYPYHVYATAYHGGRLISRHATREAAEQAVRRWRMTDCSCGCAGIIGPGEHPGTQAEQDQWSNPYAIGAI